MRTLSFSLLLAIFALPVFTFASEDDCPEDSYYDPDTGKCVPYDSEM